MDDMNKATTDKHAVSELSNSEGIVDARVDLDRERRTGYPEVILAGQKSVEQVLRIAEEIYAHSKRVLITRVTDAQRDALLEAFGARANCVVEHYEAPRLFYIYDADEFDLDDEDEEGLIVVACAGSSDLPVAEEAAICAEIFGARVERLYDVGVAGVHRALEHTDLLQKARVIIVVAGMEGALPSLVAGLVKVPVVAVPTSVGYGAHFEGITPLLAMMTSCAAGIGVVNIDNGFGAAVLAMRINSPVF